MMKDFLTLKSNLNKNYSDFPTTRVALLGDSSTQFLKQALKAYGYEVNYNFEIFEADYNQIDLQTLNNHSELYQFDPDFIIVFNSYYKLLKKFYKSNNEEKQNFSNNYAQHLRVLYNNVNEYSRAKFIFINFFECNDCVFGNFSNKVDISFSYQIKKINLSIMDLGRELKDFFICDLDFLQSYYGYKSTFDSRLYLNNDVIFNLDFLPVLASNLSSIILTLKGLIKKCVILDLDNTLWGGVIGDDGLENIQIGDLGIGKAFSELQIWLKQLKERGIILAVCSKNEESIAKEPFEKHPEMILTLDDITVFVANWESKVDNIKFIQRILNLGFDSMVFIDDNPLERDLVKTYLPQVTVPELPEDPADYLNYLHSQNLFETISFSEEDTKRTQLYKEEAVRKVKEISFSNYDEFLSNLNMRCKVESFNKLNASRIAQLTQRSNQFNLRTIRYTEEDIIKLSLSSEYLTLSFSLDDNYGSYGLVSVVILKVNNAELFIDTFIMSCRVLKRTFENFIFNFICSKARDNNFETIIGEYIPTNKNILVKDLFKDFGFLERDSKWSLNIDSYSNRKTYVAIIDN